VACGKVHSSCKELVSGTSLQNEVQGNIWVEAVVREEERQDVEDKEEEEKIFLVKRLVACPPKQGSIMAISKDGMLLVKTSTNPYDVLAMEEDSVEFEEEMEDAEMIV